MLAFGRGRWKGPIGGTCRERIWYFCFWPARRLLLLELPRANKSGVSIKKSYEGLHFFLVEFAMVGVARANVHALAFEVVVETEHGITI